MNVITKTVSLPDGRQITIETGKLAKQADGSCTLKMGNTVLLATVCAAKDAVPGTDFMPLQVEYREQYAARKSSHAVLLTAHFVHCSQAISTQRFMLMFSSSLLTA